MAGSSTHDNGDKATTKKRVVVEKRGGALDVKDIHPVNRGLGLEIKTAFRAPLIITGFVVSSDTVWVH